MWASKDSDKDLSWKGAVKDCRALKLGGFSDWRLPNLFDLGGSYDPNADAPGLSGLKPSTTMWHVKGSLFLTLCEWSSDKRPDDRGRPSAYAYSFDFNSGLSNDDLTGWPYPYAGVRASCVSDIGLDYED